MFFLRVATLRAFYFASKSFLIKFYANSTLSYFTVQKLIYKKSNN